MRSIQALADPAFVDPVSVFDWLAVIGFSAAFLLTAAGLLILRDSITPGLNTSVAIVVVAGACVIAGVMNLLEDGFGLPTLGPVYAISAIVAWLGMFVIAGMIGVSVDRSLAFVPLLTGVGFALFEIGGGVLMLAAWWAFARILVRRERRAVAARLGSSTSA
ncbi:MAG: hypothetical protein ACJ776_01200 [Chloroflexota bacterium]